MLNFDYIGYRVERFLANRTHLGRFFLDNIKRQETFFDGQRRLLTGRTARLLRLWRTNPELRHESELSFNAYRGGDVLDIGAFHGWYSLLLAPKAAPHSSFVSFEPDCSAMPDLLRSLTDIVQAFPTLHLFAIPEPVGDGAHPVTKEFPAGGGGHPRYGPATETPKEIVRDEPMTLKAACIDRFVSEFGLRPGFIKVDVEGAEYQVLSGMRQTLEKFHPTVMLEIHHDWLPAGINVEMVYDILLSCGYKQHPIDDRHAVWDTNARGLEQGCRLGPFEEI